MILSLESGANLSAFFQFLFTLIVLGSPYCRKLLVFAFVWVDVGEIGVNGEFVDILFNSFFFHSGGLFNDLNVNLIQYFFEFGDEVHLEVVLDVEVGVILKGDQVFFLGHGGEEVFPSDVQIYLFGRAFMDILYTPSQLLNKYFSFANLLQVFFHSLLVVLIVDINLLQQILSFFFNQFCNVCKLSIDGSSVLPGL